MTQTSSKPTLPNTIKDSSSAVENRTPVAYYTSANPPLSSPTFEQGGMEPTEAKDKSGFLSLFQRLRQGWDNFNFRTKLTLLLVVGAALPVIAATQSIITIAQRQSIEGLEEVLRRELIILEEEIDTQQKGMKANAKTLATFIETTGIDVSNPDQVAAYRGRLQSFLAQAKQENPARSFYIITDNQGRTVAQNIQVVAADFQNYPLLTDTETKFSPVSLSPGIELGDVPIVKNALSSGVTLAGFELLPGKFLQRLGLAEQADIGLRYQKIEGLPEPKKPFPEGTYDIDGGKAGFALVAVQPIRVQGKVVGTAIAGNLINRNYEIVDNLKSETGVSTATIFAQDWRVSTNVPYTDKKTRAIGTRVSQVVADKVLNREEDFIGAANIIGIEYTTGYSPIYDHQQELNPGQAKPVGIAYVGEPQTEVQKTLRNIALTGYGIGGGILLLAGLVAVPLAGTFSNPLRRLAGFAQEVGAGEKGVRLETSERQDEIGVLSQEMNQMVAGLEANEELLRQEAGRSQLLKDITLKLSEALDSDTVFDTAVVEIRQALKSDRAMVYRFDETWKGRVVAESLAGGWPKALGTEIASPYLAEDYVDKYKQGWVQATPDIYQAGLSEFHLQQLESLAVKANLVAPILVEGELLGLLIVHECSSPRNWEQSEIDFFAQLSTQVGLALERTNLLERQRISEKEQRSAKEQLQRRALELLTEVDSVSKGDLTIRAQVTEDEIGTIADSYNATIESLRKIVTQVQMATKQVAATTNTNEASVQELSAEALRQAEEIAAALYRIQAMSDSARTVAANAEQAEAAVRQATQTVETGDAVMNRTVDEIVAVQDTVAETAEKVKRLGESSQKISKVVSLIGKFAAQTHLLAMKASIEAARAGEGGKGFAVIADEVRSLAAQSAEATAEIETLVVNIQSETNEVAAAMETGTKQVATGTKLVEETRQSLNQIAAASSQIDRLVKAIAQAAVEQSEASQSVTQTMGDVAAIADKTSTSAMSVSASFQELLTVAQELQESVGQFKVQ